MRGKFVEKDVRRGIELLEVAAAGDNIDALMHLGARHEYGVDGFEQDEWRADDMYTRAMQVGGIDCEIMFIREEVSNANPGAVSRQWKWIDCGCSYDDFQGAVQTLHMRGPMSEPTPQIIEAIRYLERRYVLFG